MSVCRRKSAEAGLPPCRRPASRSRLPRGRGPRSRGAKGLLRSIRPDYWVCAGGAQLVDYKGADLALHRLTTEEMYALVDFF